MINWKLNILGSIVVLVCVFSFSTSINAIVKRNLKKEIVEDVPMTFYIQSTGMISTETNTSYLVRYTINDKNSKSIPAIFNSEQEKFNFLLKLHDEGNIVWDCDISPTRN